MVTNGAKSSFSRAFRALSPSDRSQRISVGDITMIWWIAMLKGLRELCRLEYCCSMSNCAAQRNVEGIAKTPRNYDRNLASYNKLQNVIRFLTCSSSRPVPFLVLVWFLVWFLLQVHFRLQFRFQFRFHFLTQVGLRIAGI